MCELFGVSSPKKIQVRELLQEFFSHGDTHPDGWGIALFSGNEVSVEKQPLNARKSLYLKARLHAIGQAANMFAHIRLATKGSVEYENTHPFTKKDAKGRTWTLIHNGTIFDSELIDPLFYEQEGQCDSERVLLYIIRKMNELYEQTKEECPSDAARFHLLDQILCDITPGNKVNLLLYDGELMYVHTNYKNSLYRRCEQGAMLFSTKPLDRKNWEPLPMNTLLAYRDGKQIFSGTDHGNEFFDSEAKMKHLFLDYAAL